MESGQAEVSGLLKVQVHYYEDGNIQLVSSKEIKEGVTFSVSGQFCLFVFMDALFRWEVGLASWHLASRLGLLLIAMPLSQVWEFQTYLCQPWPTDPGM